MKECVRLRKWKDNCSEIREHEALAGSIADRCEPEINQIPYNEIFFRYKATRGSLTKIFNSQYRSDRATVAALLKADGKPNDDAIMSILRDLRRRDELQDWMESSEELARLASLEQTIDQTFDANVFDLDIEGMGQRFITAYLGEFATSYAQFIQDVSLFDDCSRSGRPIDTDLVRAQLGSP